MIEINDNSDELIIREVDNSRWAGSAALVFCGIVGGYNLFSLREENAIIWMGVAGIISVFTSFYMIKKPGTTIKLNKKSKLLAIEKKGLFKNSLKFYPFREIAEPICAERIKTARNDGDYEFIMRLKSGEEIKFLKYAGSTGESFNAANFMNDVIFDSPDKVQFKSSAFNEISS